LFIGSEGTLGIVTEAELILTRAPEEILGVIGFFPSEEQALLFVSAARGEVGRGVSAEPSEKDRLTRRVCPTYGSNNQMLMADLPKLTKRPYALEYFDFQSLNLLRAQKEKTGSSSEIPAMSETAHTAVYIEIPTTEAGMEKDAEELLQLLEESGSSADTAWTALSPEETDKLKKFRHALPEAINQFIGERSAGFPGLTKLGTDFAVPDAYLMELFKLYRVTLDAARLDYVIFGHIGNNHVHVNILPETLAEYQQGKEIYAQFAKKVVAWGGTISAEHGVGKLKKIFLNIMYGDAGVAEMRAVKRVFDPEERLNPGNVFT
jgi:D-lactate dehydrogenase (cytochrome)